MRYKIFGPIDLTRNGGGHLDSAACASFVKEADTLAEGLSEACGCYVFGIGTSGAKGPRPWYVGKAERQSFEKECFTPHKMAIYNDAIENYVRCLPVLFLYARVVQSGRFSNPSKSTHRDVGFLENVLIGYALDRNGDLSNIKQTALLRNLKVPGLLNSGQGSPSNAAQRAAKFMGY